MGKYAQEVSNFKSCVDKGNKYLEEQFIDDLDELLKKIDIDANSEDQLAINTNNSIQEIELNSKYIIEIANSNVSKLSNRAKYLDDLEAKKDDDESDDESDEEM